MSKPLRWSNAHIASHCGCVETAGPRHTWLTRALKWFGKGLLGRKITLVRPGALTACCETRDQLFKLSQVWHGPESEVVYHFGKRTYIRIAPMQTTSRGMSSRPTRLDPKIADDTETQRKLANTFSSITRDRTASNRQPYPSRSAVNRVLTNIAAEIQASSVSPAACNHPATFKGETILDLEGMAARAEINAAQKKTEDKR